MLIGGMNLTAWLSGFNLYLVLIFIWFTALVIICCGYIMLILLTDLVLC